MAEIMEIAYGLQTSNMVFVWSRTYDGYALGKIIYIFTRYSPFFGMPLTLLGTSNIFRPRFMRLKTIKLFRPFKSPSRKVGLAIVIVILVLFLPSTPFAPSPIPEITGCFKTGVPHVISGIFILLMACEASLLSISFAHILKTTPLERPKLLQAVVREGIIYSLWMLSLSTANVLVIYLAQDAFADLLTTYQCVFHTILASHLHLHLNRYNNSILHPESTAQVSDIAFRDGNEVTV
ncbi:hypothetical protein CONPUDRAFT_70593 [Coniophora puteana RWD-64-598 SS2]|uniref:Uncharacterized protein n=1 Tax=Coniophora puteana (strain RWD-64-598) TaxID=741705 RepID=A0A5M3MXZ8_CONPW|nr:uncharacterized protein CONPUDRAFT_70593 [Coniophora puteana RWD-64-598 SS2]EIW83605.1 hypothetical protein CONPUDRAFT_70593 [Coniophora puteana RWD-64-598 SS2]